MVRNRTAGNCQSVSREDAKERFPNDSINKLGIIVKPLPDGSSKDRIIVDARESGINEKQTVPERAVLPRGVDAALDARCLAQGHAEGRITFDADEMDPCPLRRGELSAADSEQEMIGGMS